MSTPSCSPRKRATPSPSCWNSPRNSPAHTSGPSSYRGIRDHPPTRARSCRPRRRLRRRGAPRTDHTASARQSSARRTLSHRSSRRHDRAGAAGAAPRRGADGRVDAAHEHRGRSVSRAASDLRRARRVDRDPRHRRRSRRGRVDHGQHGGAEDRRAARLFGGGPRRAVGRHAFGRRDRVGRRAQALGGWADRAADERHHVVRRAARRAAARQSPGGRPERGRQQHRRVPRDRGEGPDGWVAFLDSNLNGSFEDEMPLHDYRQGRETIALGTKPITLAANFEEANGVPRLDVVFDNGGHGTHVAGIASGHNPFNRSGFEGVAPGAQLLGLKIANSARGGISVTGSMQRAMEYAARYAEQRNLPLVLNLSFGVGNEFEGRAVIDSIVDAFLMAHPSVVFTISAGNDGPGLSTLGFPGSADLALSIGALFPGAFARPAQAGTPPAADVLGWWSSRGGELAKPDLVTPGVAFSSVPRWDTGNEIKGGTSMAAPHAAGLAACLISAMLQEGRKVSAADLAQALRASAEPFAGASAIDEGAGVPQLEAAYRWLLGGHQGSEYIVRSRDGTPGAFRRDGLAGPGDTLQAFRVRHVAGLRAAQFLLRSSVAWLSVPGSLEAGPRETEIRVVYSPAALTAPGAHVGGVTAWNASDTLAGPLFTLANTIVAPYDLAAKPLYDERRAIGPARVQRYFLRVAQPGATLAATVTLPDSAEQRATARLYEPNGQPFRELEEVQLGRSDPGTGRFVVHAEDIVPGVYELDVIAAPLSGVSATVRAEVAPLALTGLEASNPGNATTGGRLTEALLGAERSVEVTARGAPPESLTVRVPDWAARAVVDVQMPREQWDEFTDFGVTEFDSTGQQVGQGAMNYAVGRHSFEIPPARRDRPITVELFPAFARA